MKKEVVKILQKALKKKKIDLEPSEIEKLIGTPPSSEMGDFAFPCFSLVSKLKMPPQEIALELRQEIGNPPANFSEITTLGPYVNFFTNRKSLSIDLVNEIIREKDNYGKVKAGKKQLKTMVEFPSPNTNKPLHIGHLRNMTIGEAISRISEFNGEKVIRSNLNNDRGIHICKSMAAYEKFGKKAKPGKMKSDHFVGKYYVMFGQKSKKDKNLELFSHRLLQEWEAGNKKVVKLWERMNKWAYDGFEKTYKDFGINSDINYYESKLYKHGKEIVDKGLKNKVFQKRKDGAVVIGLGKELGEKVLLRIDGTSVYIVQDLYLAQLKFKDHKLDKSYYVVGNEQEYHFRVLFNILEKLGFKQNMKHISFGMVTIPGGKIKSREGTKGINADEIMGSVQTLVKKELTKRSKLSKSELEKKSSKIALGAIKYFLLKVDMKKNMFFNPKEAISFEGDTGPYVQYSYARASSIIKKEGKEKIRPKFKMGELTLQEVDLLKKLSQFKEISNKAYLNLNPSIIANYSYQLSQKFNEFYHASKVIGSEEQAFRLKLVEAFRQVLKNSLSLIGIEVLEEM